MSDHQNSDSEEPRHQRIAPRRVGNWQVRDAQLSETDTGNTVARRSSPFAVLASRAGVDISEVANAPGSGESTPQQRGTIIYSSYMERPRSNPRTRIPMRYESPLSPSAFRRQGSEDVSPPPSRREGQRVTVRPLVAGISVGSLAPRRIGGEQSERPTTPLSSKQGPSNRKLRRWNNDNFVGVASELANASSRGPAVAQTLLQAREDAPRYLSVFNPQDNAPSPNIAHFISDESMKHVRDSFFAGEIGLFTGSAHQQRRRPQESKHDAELTPDVMMRRIHDRLRRVVVRACSNSLESTKLVNDFELYLIRCFRQGAMPKLSAKTITCLLEPPTVTRRKSGHTIARFFFNSNSTSGGFHRLLLHAVAQFHGLHAVSTTIDVEIQGMTQARLLTVTGNFSGAEFRLAECATGAAAAKQHAHRSSKKGQDRRVEVSVASDLISAMRIS